MHLIEGSVRASAEAPDRVRRSPRFGPFPTAIYARLDRQEGWSKLQESVGDASPCADIVQALEAERRQLAIDWIQAAPPSCRVESAVGHVRSRQDPRLFHLFEVAACRGLLQPARFVVTIGSDDYARLGFDPFVARAAGLFRFGDWFKSNPCGGSCDSAWVEAELTPSDLGDETSAPSSESSSTVEGLVFRVAHPSPALERRVAAFVASLTPARRAEVTINSFHFGDGSTLDRSQPFVGCVFDPGATGTEVAEVLRATAARPGFAPSSTHVALSNEVDAPAPATERAAAPLLRERDEDPARIEGWIRRVAELEAEVRRLRSKLADRDEDREAVAAPRHMPRVARHMSPDVAEPRAERSPADVSSAGTVNGSWRTLRRSVDRFEFGLEVSIVLMLIAANVLAVLAVFD